MSDETTTVVTSQGKIVTEREREREGGSLNYHMGYYKRPTNQLNNTQTNGHEGLLEDALHFP